MNNVLKFVVKSIAKKSKAVPKIDFKQLWPYLFPMVQAILIFIVGHFVIVLCLKLINKALKKTKVDDLVLNLLHKAVNIVLHIIVLLSALSAVGVSTTGLVAALSAVAAGIALALKDSFGNIAGGIMLICSPRFAAGDYVLIDGEEGKVVKIDLTHTSIIKYNNNEVSLPNGTLINSKIVNLTNEGVRRVDITVPVPYDCNIEKVKDVLFKVMEDNANTFRDGEHKQFAKIYEYGQSSVNILCCTWCKADDYWRVYFNLMQSNMKALAKEDVYIPYNKLDVNLINNKD